jgi:hypothetical protein
MSLLDIHIGLLIVYGILAMALNVQLYRMACSGQKRVADLRAKLAVHESHLKDIADGLRAVLDDMDGLEGHTHELPKAETTT